VTRVNRTSFFRAQRPSAAIFIASFAGFLVAVGVIQVIEYDVFWHLATGIIMSLLGIIPRNDIFSYTAFGAPWVNHEWLFQLMQWKLFSAAGIDGLIAVKFAIAASISLILFFTIRHLTRSMNLALWCVIPFLWATSSRVMDRPFFLGMCFLAVYMLILHRYVREGTRAILALPILQILWINCHGGGFLGVQLIGAFALGETFQLPAFRWLGGPEPIGRERIRLLWLVAAAALAACAVNPWGIEIFPFYIEHLRMTSILAFTEEWLPVLHPMLDGLIPPLIFLATAILTMASFVLNASRARLSLLIVSCGTILLLTKGPIPPKFDLDE